MNLSFVDTVGETLTSTAAGVASLPEAVFDAVTIELIAPPPPPPAPRKAKDDDGGGGGGGGLPIAAVAGGAGGGVVLLLVVGGVIYFRRRNKQGPRAQARSRRDVAALSPRSRRAPAEIATPTWQPTKAARGRRDTKVTLEVAGKTAAPQDQYV